MAWLLLIGILLSIPGSNIPSSQIWAFDKVGHTGLFFMLSLLWLNAVREKRNRVVAGIIIAGVMLGPLSEVYQGLFPIGRLADPYDAVANITGFLLGTGLWFIISRVKTRNTGDDLHSI
jgi:VanZ family protein